MNTTKITETLYAIFNALNARYFDNELPQPFIIIKQGKTKSKNVYGTFTADSWVHKEGEETNENGEVTNILSDTKIHEIAMSGEYLSRPLANMCTTLCHEMVHLYCKINNIKDTSNNGVYHNNNFKQQAECRDLIIEKAQTIGWSVTTPSTNFIDFINSLNIDENVFSYFRDTWEDTTSKTTTKKRWICPICGTQVQGKKDINIGCWDCQKQMDYVDITDETNPEFIIDNNHGLAYENWVNN